MKRLMTQLNHRSKADRSWVSHLSSVLLSSAAVTLAGLGGCSSEPPAFNPNNLQKLARAHASENATHEMRPLPDKLESAYLTTTQPASRPSFAPATQPGPATQPSRRMSLREAIRVAVAHNADVHVNSYQPAIDQARVIESQAAYDLKFFTNFQYANQNDLFPSAVNPTISPIAGRNTIVLGDLQVQSGFRQETASGAKIELSAKTDEFIRDGPGTKIPGKRRSLVLNPAFKPNPFWTNDITFQVTQPVLQNFGSAANAARIAIAKNTQRSSMLDFRLNLEKNMFELEQAYWQLVQAEQTVKIGEALLARTMDTAGLLKKRLGTPGTTNTEVAQANAAVESRRAALDRSRAQVADLSDVIKNKMNDPDFPVATGDLVLPADLPIDIPVHFDAAEQIQTALTYRAELSQQQVKIDSAEITVRAAKSNELPKLDLIGSIGLLGVGKDWGSAVQSQGRFDYTDFTLGFQLEIPIGNREARAIFTRTQLQRQQEIERYRMMIDQVTLDVNKARREVETTWNEMIHSRQARIAAEEELHRLDVDERFREGAMSPGFINTKLDAQARLSEQAQREITAIVNYNIGISALERAKGTILRYDNIVLEENPRPNTTARLIK